MQMLDGRGDMAGGGSRSAATHESADSAPTESQATAPVDDFDDDIPF